MSTIETGGPAFPMQEPQAIHAYAIAAADEHEDAQALFDAEFALMTGELLRLLPAIVAAMGGELARTPDLIDNAKEQA